MTTDTEQFDLDWHREWVLPTVEAHALAAFAEAHDLTQEPAEEVWKRIGRALLADIYWCMTPIEASDFIAQAQIVACDLYLQRLQQLVSTSPQGGHA